MTRMPSAGLFDRALNSELNSLDDKRFGALRQQTADKAASDHSTGGAGGFAKKRELHVRRSTRRLFVFHDIEEDVRNLYQAASTKIHLFVDWAPDNFSHNMKEA